jgi:hypothetical protein
MTINELISKPKNKLILKLWECNESSSQNLADILSELADSNSLFAFDRYTWSALSSGQMPPELMASQMADFITISIDEKLHIPESMAKCIKKADKVKIHEQVDFIEDTEPDFNKACYLIVDEENTLHFTSTTYNFEQSIKGCFFSPTKQILKELSERVRDKEKIQIDTGIQPRC